MSNDPGRKRTASLWDEITENRVILVSTVGSVASIAALIITLMDKVVLERGLDPQVAAWRFILILACLLCIGSTVFSVYHWTARVLRDQSRSVHERVFWSTLRILVGFLFVGIFWDGLFAALYWRPWMYSISRDLLQFVRQVF